MRIHLRGTGVPLFPIALLLKPYLKKAYIKNKKLSNINPQFIQKVKIDKKNIPGYNEITSYYQCHSREDGNPVSYLKVFTLDSGLNPE